MRRSALGALALTVALPTVLIAGAPSADAAVSVPSVAGFVADDVHHRVFLGNSQAGTILAASYAGDMVDSAAGISGITDLALSADSQVLYAASWDTHEIVALDPATLNEIARYTVSTTYGPRHVAFSGGKLWFSYGDQWSGNLGYVSPSTGNVAMNQYSGHVWGQALLDASTSDPDLLAVGETGLSTDSMAVLDTSGATPAQVAFHNGDYTLNDGIADIDLVPGAPQVVVNGRERQAYAGGHFSAAGAYPNGYEADISSTGLVATATDDKVRVFRPNAPVPLSSFAGGAAALAWSDDESKLFVLEGSRPYTLAVIDAPGVAKPTLSVSAPGSAPRGQQLTVSGSLSSGVPFPSDVSLDVVRKDVEHPSGTSLPDVTVASDGSWSFQDTPKVGGPVTYEVTYAGDADHQAVTASATVDVARQAPELTLRPRGGTYAYGKKVTLTAHLGGAYDNRSLELWADPYGDDKPRSLVKNGNVDAHGDISFSVTLRRNTEISAVYAGDARTAPRTVTVTAKAHVSIHVDVTHEYRTARTGGHKYFLFHQRTSPVVTTAMPPFDGRAERMDVQLLDGGKWRAVDSEFFGLGTSGKVAVRIAAPNRSGIKARVRTSYIRKASGDKANATTYGHWIYINWTR